MNYRNYLLKNGTQQEIIGQPITFVEKLQGVFYIFSGKACFSFLVDADWLKKQEKESVSFPECSYAINKNS